MRRGCLLVAVVILLQLRGAAADAQCGATVSSCRQCHEIDKQLPVLADGRPWHNDHAFGDFCVACHGGDDAAKDSAAAHQVLVDPLGDAALRCGTAMCHGTKAEALAAGYRHAARLGAPSPPLTQVSAPKANHNTLAGIAAVAVALLGAAYVSWNERRRREAKR